MEKARQSSLDSHVYQNMSRMRQISHSSAQDHESNLDALLEDLQTTVSRSNSQLNLNGTMTTGYREIRRIVTDGTPHNTMNEYQIEYLNPANSTHHITESNNSYSSGSQRHRDQYKESYNYSGSEHRSGGRSDVKLKQNISELDSLLDDLNTAQKKSFSENTTGMRHTQGIDQGLLEPVISSTPQGHRHEEKHFREERVVRGRSTSPRRELIFTGTSRSQDPSPIQPVRQQQFYRYEKTTSTRSTGPVMTDVTSPVDSNHYSRGHNLAIEDGSLRGRSPSPGGNRIEYHYTKTTTDNREGVPHFPVENMSKYREQHDSREYSPQSYTGGKTSNSYIYSSNSSSTRESRSEVPRSPPPHRSPSPVSFQQPPPPNNKVQGPYSYEPPPQSPQPPHRFSPVQEPNHNTRLTYNVSQPHTTVSNYKYSSTTTTNNYNSSHGYPEEAPLLPRPFPSPSPTPEQQEQQPPKKLDELMASFSETELRNRRNDTVHKYDREREQRETENLNQHLLPNGKDREKIIEKEKQVVKKEESKNVQGPPVYYPPGELFTKKEESMAQQQSGGAMYKSKAKYEYEAMSKSKSKESSGKAVVPVCLPVCCAMPCTIM